MYAHRDGRSRIRFGAVDAWRQGAGGMNTSAVGPQLTIALITYHCGTICVHGSVVMNHCIHECLAEVKG